jgi:hypothetical protein
LGGRQGLCIYALIWNASGWPVSTSSSGYPEYLFADLARRHLPGGARQGALAADRRSFGRHGCCICEQDQREAIEALAAELGVPFLGLWLYANPETLLERVALRGADASDANHDVVNRQLGVDPGPFTAQWRPIDAGGPPRQTLATASGALKEFARSLAQAVRQVAALVCTLLFIASAVS